MTNRTLQIAEQTSNPEKFKAIISHVNSRIANLQAPTPVIKKIREENDVLSFLKKEEWESCALWRGDSRGQKHVECFHVGKGTRELTDGMGWYKERSFYASIAFGKMRIEVEHPTKRNHYYYCEHLYGKLYPSSSPVMINRRIELALVHYGLTGLTSDGKTCPAEVEIQEALDLKKPLEDLIKQVDNFFRFHLTEEELKRYTPEMVQETIEESKKLAREKKEEKKAKLQVEIAQLQAKLKKIK